MSNVEKMRPIDEVAQKNYSWLGKSFVFIQKTKIKTLHGVFILAFVCGASFALVWSVSAGYHLFSSAASIVPVNSCIPIPAGGIYDSPTNIVIKCGKYVQRASYEWVGGENDKVINIALPKAGRGVSATKTIFEAKNNQSLRIFGVSGGGQEKYNKALSRFEKRKINYQNRIEKLLALVAKYSNNPKYTKRVKRYENNIKKYQGKIGKMEVLIKEVRDKIAFIDQDFNTSYFYQIKDRCFDSDGGINYFEKGEITVKYENGQSRVENDICNGNGTLREWFCGNVNDSAGLLRSENYVNCEFGCQGGACHMYPYPYPYPYPITSLLESIQRSEDDSTHKLRLPKKSELLSSDSTVNPS